MQKRILIIGNSSGLPGVKVDVQNYKVFFKSAYGGNWYESEIIEKLNPTKDDILSELNSLKNMNLDYLIVVFSGHGGQARDTVLELNDKPEYLSEERFSGLAVRQLLIYDCCRTFSASLLESIKNRLEQKAYSSTSTKERYERRILQAVPQTVSLYACAIGETAHDTSSGGAYSKALIDGAIGTAEFTAVGVAHMRAAEQTTREFPDQHPDAVLPRCLSTETLILGIKP
jgi:hypothetical protein